MPASTIIVSPRLRAPAGGLEFNGRSYRGGSYLPNAARPALEAVAAKAAEVAQAEPITIGILGFAYRVKPITINPKVGTIAFNLTDTARNRSYFTHRDIHGECKCDCPDFTFRREGTGLSCKHIRRLAELGLIAPTTPHILPPLAARKALPRSWDAPTPRGRYEPTPDEIAEAASLLLWGVSR